MRKGLRIIGVVILLVGLCGCAAEVRRDAKQDELPYNEYQYIRYYNYFDYGRDYGDALYHQVRGQ